MFQSRSLAREETPSEIKHQPEVCHRLARASLLLNSVSRNLQAADCSVTALGFLILSSRCTKAHDERRLHDSLTSTVCGLTTLGSMVNMPKISQERATTEGPTTSDNTRGETIWQVH